MSTLFTKIIQGEIPSYKIAENAFCFAFLDINPIAKGHTLVVPKIETDYLFDLPDETLHQLMDFAKPIAKALDKAFSPLRTGVIVEGLLVPHAHVHLVPIYTKTQKMALGMNELSFTKDEMLAIAEQIRKELN